MFDKQFNKALSFVLNKEPKDLCPSKNYFDEECKSVFREIHILASLAFALHSISLINPDEKTKEINEWIVRTSSYLKELGDKKYSFSYWDESESDKLKQLLPDDLDDTALCLSALQKAGVEISEKFFLKIINQETKPGGPYYTWYVDRKSDVKGEWNDIDVVVNANLLYSMALFGITLSRTEEFLLDCIKNDNISSPYYPYDLTFYFYFARYVSAKKDHVLADFVRRRLSQYQKCGLCRMEKLLLALSQVYLGNMPGDDVIEEILSWQKDDGSFPALSLFYDFSVHKKSTFTASEVMTSALVLELLIKYKQLLHSTKEIEESRKEKLSDFQKQQVREIKKNIKKSRLKEVLEKTLPEVDVNHTSLKIPVLVLKELKQKPTRSDQEVILKVTAALYFGWWGYTLIDDIVDRQRELSDLAVAVELINIYRGLNEEFTHDIPSFAREIRSALSLCNLIYNEEINQKVISYDNIYEKVEPYLVTLRNIPVFLGLDKEVGDKIYTIFRNIYLISQLNDDAHDWQEDWEAKRVTYITSILKKCEKEIDEPALIFWKKVMPEIIRICEEKYREAKILIEKMGLKDGQLDMLLERHIKPIHLAKEERKKAMNLLKNFKK